MPGGVTPEGKVKVSIFRYIILKQFWGIIKAKYSKMNAGIIEKNYVHLEQTRLKDS